MTRHLEPHNSSLGSFLSPLKSGIGIALILGSSVAVQGQSSLNLPDSFSAPAVQEDASRSARPSFLPPPKPVAPEPSQSSHAEGQQISQAPATMVTQVEIPVPQPVADAPHIMEGAPTIASALVGGDAAEIEAPRSQSPAIVYEGDQAGIQKTVAVAAPPPLDPGLLLKQKRYTELEPVALRTQDSTLAAAIGWSHYSDRNYTQSSKWFQRALEVDDRNYEAAYGLSLVLTRQGEFDKAEEVARWRLAEYPRMKNVLGDVTTARAIAAYQAKNYRRSRALFEEVKTYRSLTRDEQILQAWNFFHSGDTALAAAEFERLYLEKQDKFTAGAVFAALSKTKNWDRLKELSQIHGGALSDLYQEHIAQRFYDKGLYASALATAPEKFPELAGYTSPSVAVGAGARFKTGDGGRSKLREYRVETSGVLYQNDFHRLSMKLGLTSLDSGSLPDHALVGKAPLDEKRAYKVAPTTSYDSLVDVRLRYEHEGTYTPSVELGISPAGGDLSPTIVGSVGLRGSEDWGTWNVGIYRESVKESILSYVGIRDPYTGDAWGRVTDSGMRLSLYAPLEDQWSVYSEAVAGVLDGTDVASNTHFKLTLAFNKEIIHPDFAYITIGPTLSFEHYGKNLSYFTEGHGGYFSPDYLFQGTVGARFMTKEGRGYLVRGGVELGLQSYRQGTTDIFPLENRPSVYSQTDDQTFIALVNVEALLQLTSRWAVGGAIGYNRTADYSEFSASLSLKYFFESRAGLFGSDFAR